MSHQKLRIHNTDIDNLTSNLRGEVGEIISTWVMMKSFMVQAYGLRTQDVLKDLENPRLVMLDTLIDKLSDEIVSRLAELGEQKVGRLNFHFAQLKLCQFEKEALAFNRFIEKNRFHEKRNYNISHKELPEKWTEQKIINISYPVVVRGIVMALVLMKKIDSLHLGPRTKYLWQEMRKRRYKITYPAKIRYTLMPYLWLSHKDRGRIIKEEFDQGHLVWKDMNIKINGKETIIKTYGEMGAIVLGGRLLLLDQPFLELTSIDFPPPSEEKGREKKVRENGAYRLTSTSREEEESE